MVAKCCRLATCSHHLDTQRQNYTTNACNYPFARSKVYWCSYSISIHPETKHHTCKPESSAWSSSTACSSIRNCNQEISLAVSTFTQHEHQLIKCTQTKTDILQSPFCLVCGFIFWTYAWTRAFFSSWKFWPAAYGRRYGHGCYMYFNMGNIMSEYGSVVCDNVSITLDLTNLIQFSDPTNVIQ